MDPALFCIVDDDLPFGKSLQRLLRARGVRAEHFRSAQSFLDSIPPGERGYAIVDIQMPICDGFELMKKMRELYYSMPVIVITGQPFGGARERALQNGAVGYLEKPFSAEALLDSVRRHEMDGNPA